MATGDEPVHHRSRLALHQTRSLTMFHRLTQRIPDSLATDVDGASQTRDVFVVCSGMVQNTATYLACCFAQ